MKQFLKMPLVFALAASVPTAVLGQSNSAPASPNAASVNSPKPGSAARSASSNSSLAPERLGPVEMGPPLTLTVGKSTLLRLPQPIERISIGNPSITDVTLISSRELYLIGKSFGTTNVMLWLQNGGTTVIDVTTQIDTATLQEQMRRLLPSETRIEIRSAAESIVLTGSVSSAQKAAEAVEIAESFLKAYTRTLSLPLAQNTAPSNAAGAAQRSGGGAAAAPSGAGTPAVVNLLKIDQPMQVMLEVKVAEINRTLLEKLGVSLQAANSNGKWTWGILSALAPVSPSNLGISRVDGRGIQLDAEKQDGLVKILAEPSLIALSGSEARFLAGGKIFIPTARATSNGVTTIALEEKSFGVGLTFLPVVLDQGNISLKLRTEISEVNQSGNPFATIGGVTTILPGFSTREAETLVRLGDGQSLAIAGLIKNNVTQNVKKVPMLGELPILGPLFRSVEFQNDRTELLVIVTPRIVKALNSEPTLPTAAFRAPSRAENAANGSLEGSGHADVPVDRGAPSKPKLEMK